MTFTSENLIQSVEKNLKESDMKFQNLGVASRPAYINKSESPKPDTPSIAQSHVHMNSNSNNEHHYNNQMNQQSFLMNRMNHQPPPPPSHMMNQNTMPSNNISFIPHQNPMYPIQTQQQQQQNMDYNKKIDATTNILPDQRTYDPVDSNRLGMTKKVLEEKIFDKKKQETQENRSSDVSVKIKEATDSQNTRSKKYDPKKKTSLWRRTVLFFNDKRMFLLLILVIIIILCLLAILIIPSLNHMVFCFETSEKEDSFRPTHVEPNPIIKQTQPFFKNQQSYPNVASTMVNQTLPNNQSFVQPVQQQQQMVKQTENVPQQQINPNFVHSNVLQEENNEKNVTFSLNKENDSLTQTHAPTVQSPIVPQLISKDNNSESQDSFCNYVANNQN